MFDVVQVLDIFFSAFPSQMLDKYKNIFFKSGGKNVPNMNQ